MNSYFQLDYAQSSSELLDRKQACRFLKATFGLPVTPASLATAAVRGGGPRYAHMGRYVRYLKADLVEWASSRCSGFLDSTSTPHNQNTGKLFSYEPDIRANIPRSRPTLTYIDSIPLRNTTADDQLDHSLPSHCFHGLRAECDPEPHADNAKDRC